MTSLKEMLELPNFSHMSTSIIQIDIIYNIRVTLYFVCDVMNRNYDIINFIPKYLYFKKV